VGLLPRGRGRGQLVAVADGTRARPAAWVYVTALAAMFGASAYHRYPSGRRPAGSGRAARPSMIFLFIAGTYTPFAVLAFSGTPALGGARDRLGRCCARAPAQLRPGSDAPK
jgi:channel protein (hemolysin III family)